MSEDFDVISGPPARPPKIKPALAPVPKSEAKVPPAIRPDYTPPLPQRDDAGSDPVGS